VTRPERVRRCAHAEYAYPEDNTEVEVDATPIALIERALTTAACACFACACFACAGVLHAQSIPAPRIDTYGYIIDVDIPESPSLVALDLTTSRALRAAASKPVAAAFVHSAAAGGDVDALAIDVAPYYLAGGIRSLDAYKKNSVAGRMMRVLTKTVLSLAVARDGGRDDARIAFAVRSTIHDPHDPVLNWGLADSLIAHPDADPRVFFDHARDDMRRRCCVQLALGWGGDATMRGGVISRDSTTRLQQQLWGTAQITTGERYDILLTPKVVDVFGDASLAVAGGIQRKGDGVDFRADAEFRNAHDIRPSIAAEVHVLRSIGAVASISSTREGGDSHIVFRTLGRWYVSHRP
jgi:hypothetical protein